MIKNFEIVDTPGLGDPIMSRSEKTKEFLIQCDLVILLSTTSQFMNQEDIQFMMKTLPGESVNRAVIVGSKFDSVLLDDSSRGRNPLKKVAAKTILQLNQAAKKHIDECLKSNCGYSGALLLQRLKADMPSEDKPLATPPYYISSVLYGAAKNIAANRSLSEMEEHILNQLTKRFDGVERTPEFLLGWARIDEIKEKEFTKIKKLKEEIIAEKSQEFVRTQKDTFLRQLDDIQTEAEQNLQTIKSEDIDMLNKKLEKSQRALTSMRRNIRNVFESCAIDAEKYMVTLANDMKFIAQNYTTVNVSEATRQHHRSKKVGFWIFGHTEHWTETEHYQVATVNDVLSNIHNYINDAESNIGRNLDKAIDINSVKDKVKETVLNAFKKSDEDFDANDIVGPIDVVLSQMTIPPFNIVNREKYQQMILNSFSQAQVEGEDIHQLVLKQGQVLQEVAADITKSLESKAKYIKELLNDKALTFTDDVKEQIETKINLLQKNIQNKEESIKTYNDFLSRLKQYKTSLRQINSME